jgi:PAS domain S-box-containing protein
MKLGQIYRTWISPQRWLDRAGIRPPMQIVLGLVMLLACVLQFARVLQLVSGEDAALVRVRIVLAEMASSRVAAQIAGSDYPGARTFLQWFVQAHEEIRSAALRRLDGTIAMETPGHDRYWIASPGDESTPMYLHVALYENKVPWGRLEIAFRPLHEQQSFLASLENKNQRAAFFVLGASFLLFWFFLARMLKTLDPSGAVPDRMQSMMDTLVEGMVILDNDDQIVMANQAFARLTYMPVDRLIGRALTTLPWLAADRPNNPEVYPWKAVQESNLPQRGVQLRLQVGSRHERRLKINASPIVDPNGTRRGVLVTFDDQTSVESENLELARFVAKFSQAGEEIAQARRESKSEGNAAQLARLEELAEAAKELAATCQVAGRDVSIPLNADTQSPDPHELSAPAA